MREHLSTNPVPPDSQSVDVRAIGEELLAAWDAAETLPLISSGVAGFDLADAYEVLGHISEQRRGHGWKPVGRKIGFTNRTIWERYGVDRPMWAPIWDRTVLFAARDHASVPLAPLMQPRIEPEVVFRLRENVPSTDDPAAILSCVEWIAPGFEIVQCHFPDWRFTL